MNAVQESGFRVTGAGAGSLSGALNFANAGRLLSAGSASINAREVSVIDLAGVTGADSAGLALLIEWLSVAQAAGQSLRYDNVPAQLLQLARLCDVEALIVGKAAVAAARQT